MKYNNNGGLLNSSSSYNHVYKWVIKPKRGSKMCLKRP